MKIKPLELELFLHNEMRGAKPLETSEIIVKFEQFVSRKSLMNLIHTTLSLPLRNINSHMSTQSLVETYIPFINLGRCQGHTQALAEYLKSDNRVSDITVVAYDNAHRQNILSRLTGHISNYNIVTVFDFSHLEDYSLYPHVVFDSRCTFDSLKNTQLRPLLESSKIVVLGA